MSKPSQAVLERQKKKITPCIRRRTTALQRFPLPQPSLVVPQLLPKPRTLPEPGTPMPYAPTEIKAHGKHFILHAPLVCQVDDQGDFCCIEHEGLSIIAYGDSRAEAERDFNEWFVHEYVENSAWDEAYLGMYRDAFHLMKSLIKEVINVEEV